MVPLAADRPAYLSSHSSVSVCVCVTKLSIQTPPWALAWRPFNALVLACARLLLDLRKLAGAHSKRAVGLPLVAANNGGCAPPSAARLLATACPRCTVAVRQPKRVAALPVPASQTGANCQAPAASQLIARSDRPPLANAAPNLSAPAAGCCRRRHHPRLSLASHQGRRCTRVYVVVLLISEATINKCLRLICDG